MVRSMVRLRCGAGRYETVRRTRVTVGYLQMTSQRGSFGREDREHRERGCWREVKRREWETEIESGTHHAW